MLSKERREDLVRAFNETHNANMVARIFQVSRRTVYTYVEMARKGISLEVRTSQRGRKPEVTEQDKENIKNCIHEKPDITIHEINDKLNLPVKDEEVRRIVRAMGFRRKKKSLHAIERGRPRCAGEEEAVEKPDQDT